jgi:hypothetical protein
MARGQGSWAYIQFVERSDMPDFGGGRPGGIDPDWGVDEGGHPDQGLPGGRPGWAGGEHPGNRPPGSRPPRPGQGLPPSWGEGHPGHLPSRPGRPGGGRPGRPDQGLPGGGDDGDLDVGQLPVWPVNPDHPIAPPIPGEPNPPVDPPPGTVWPPLPEGLPEGKAVALMAIATSGGKMAYHYVIIEIPPAKPDQGLPGGGTEPEHPEVQPPQPGQPLPGQPPTAQPRVRRP